VPDGPDRQTDRFGHFSDLQSSFDRHRRDKSPLT
jgi:hypothetical protein